MKTVFQIALIAILILIAGFACSAESDSAVVIPQQVTCIQSEAFLNDSSLQTVIIPEGATTIESRAFANSSVTSIELPSTLQYVSEDAFTGCENLSSVSMDTDTLFSLDLGQLFKETAWIHSSGADGDTRWLLTNDGKLYLYGSGTPLENAWQDDRNLIRSLYIGENISFDRSMLLFGRNPTSIYVHPDNKDCFIKEQCLLSKDGTVLIAIPNGIDGTFTIPNGVQRIGNHAFADCMVANVIMPDTVVEIDSFAFYGSCITEFDTGKNVRTIGNSAFAACPYLTTLYFGDSLQTIGGNIVADSRDFTGFNVSSRNKNFSSFDGVLLNGDGTCILACPAGYRGSYTCPQTVTSIEDGAFNSCRYLTDIVLPNQLLRIGNGAFNRCYA